MEKKLDDMKKEEVQEVLRKSGIEFDAKAKKDELLELAKQAEISAEEDQREEMDDQSPAYEESAKEEESQESKEARGVKPFYIGKDPSTGEKLYRDLPAK